MDIDGNDDIITAYHDSFAGSPVVACCLSSATDRRPGESMGEFVARHGGTAATAQYLSDCSN